MSKLSTIVAIGTLSVGSAAMAANYTVAPGDLATGKTSFSGPHGTGSNPFAYDWDSVAPDSGPDAPAGYGSNSFYGNVAQSGLTQADRYRTLRIGVQDLFTGDPVTISDIASISYQTKKNLPQTNTDWRVTIYTTPGDKGSDPSDTSTGSGDSANWYRSRIQSLPYESDSLNAPSGAWNTWTTDAGVNSMNFFTNRAGLTAHDISWSELTSGTVDRANDWDFSGEQIMMMDLTLGANTGGGNAASYLDAVRITLTDSQVADVNLVPEPSAFALVGLGFGALLLRRRRRTA